MTIVMHGARPPESPVPAPTVPAPGSSTDRNSSPRFRDLLSQRHPQSDAPEFLGDAVPARSDARSEAHADADMFNEHGFFQGMMADPGSMGLSSSDRPGIDAATAASSNTVSELDLLPAPVVGADQVGPALDRMVGPDEPGPQRLMVEMGRVGSGVIAGAAEAPGITRPAQQVVKGDVQASRTIPSRSLLLSRQAERAGGALNPLISIQAVEHGLRVVAQLGALDQDERVRLRDRISGLLSRHGLVAREIELNGQTSSAEDR